LSVQLLATQAVQDPALMPAKSTGPLQDNDLNELWIATTQKDTMYQTVLCAVTDSARTLPSEIKIKIQAGDCSLDANRHLRH